METPDISKHLKEMIGGLAMELATAKAVIEVYEKAAAAAERSGRPDGARGADGPGTEGGDHGT